MANIIYKNYYIKFTIIIIIVWLGCFISIFIYLCYEYNSNFFHLGPGNNILFLNFTVDNWLKWSFIMSYSFFSQFISSFVSSSLSPFITNVIRDHKCEWNESILNAQLIILIYKLYSWFHDICEIFLVLTLQLQFYLPALIADLIVSFITTRNYIINKNNYNYLTTIKE